MLFLFCVWKTLHFFTAWCCFVVMFVQLGEMHEEGRYIQILVGLQMFIFNSSHTKGLNFRSCFPFEKSHIFPLSLCVVFCRICLFKFLDNTIFFLVALFKRNCVFLWHMLQIVLSAALGLKLGDSIDLCFFSSEYMCTLFEHNWSARDVPSCSVTVPCSWNTRNAKKWEEVNEWKVPEVPYYEKFTKNTAEKHLDAFLRAANYAGTNWN